MEREALWHAKDGPLLHGKGNRRNGLLAAGRGAAVLQRRSEVLVLEPLSLGLPVRPHALDIYTHVYICRCT